MPRLTRLEWKAVQDVLNERIAGGAWDLRDALALTDREAVAMMRRLERVAGKLAALPPTGGARAREEPK